MIEGYIRQSGVMSDPDPVSVQGRPLRGFFRRVREVERDARIVRTYRCISCGFVESYAKEPTH